MRREHHLERLCLEQHDEPDQLLQVGSVDELGYRNRALQLHELGQLRPIDQLDHLEQLQHFQQLCQLHELDELYLVQQ